MPIRCRYARAAVRKEITRLARALNGQHRPLFMGDPKLKDRPHLISAFSRNALSTSVWQKPQLHCFSSFSRAPPRRCIKSVNHGNAFDNCCLWQSGFVAF